MARSSRHSVHASLSRGSGAGRVRDPILAFYPGNDPTDNLRFIEAHPPGDSSQRSDKAASSQRAAAPSRTELLKRWLGSRLHLYSLVATCEAKAKKVSGLGAACAKAGVATAASAKAVRYFILDSVQTGQIAPRTHRTAWANALPLPVFR